MNDVELHKWLVRYSIALNKRRKLISKNEKLKLEFFDEMVSFFLESCPNWWSSGSDRDLQATISPNLFLQSVLDERYPITTYEDYEKLEKSKQASQFNY